MSSTPISAALGTTAKTAVGATKLYDDWADTYDESLTSWGYPAPTRVAETLSAYGVGPTSKVLDLGCGTGLSGVAMSARGIGSEVGGGLFGTDLSEKSLRVAEAKGCYKQVRLGNLDQGLPFEADFFSAVACVGVTSYIENFKVFFEDALRVTKPGGLIVWTHQSTIYDTNYRDVKTEASRLTVEGEWELVHEGEEEAYMPENPDPEEANKRIRIIVYKKK